MAERKSVPRCIDGCGRAVCKENGRCRICAGALRAAHNAELRAAGLPVGCAGSDPGGPDHKAKPAATPRRMAQEPRSGDGAAEAIAAASKALREAGAALQVAAAHLLGVGA